MNKKLDKIPRCPSGVDEHEWYRLWFYTEPNYDGCVLWTGEINRGGYGIMPVGCTYKFVHRLVCDWCKAPLAAWQVVHHKCRTRNCVNPDHLEPMSRAAHEKLHGRPRLPAKPHDGSAELHMVRPGEQYCRRGHEHNEANTYVAASGDRRCKLCAALWEKNHREERAAKSLDYYYRKQREKKADLTNAR